MSSLPINDGTWNPKNFRNTKFLYGPAATRSQRPGAGVDTGWITGANQHIYYSTDIFIGKVLPNFHRRRNSGELLPHTYYYYERCSPASIGRNEVNMVINDGSPNGLLYVDRKWKNDDPFPFQEHNVLLGSLSRVNVEDVLYEMGIDPRLYVQQAASKIYSRGWDGLTFLAELHQVVRMFKGAVYQFVDLVYQYAGYKRRAASKYTALKTFNQWLAGRYGWRILVFDIKQINETIQNFDKEQMARVKDHAGSSGTHYIDRSHDEVFSSYINSVADITQLEVNVRGSIIADFLPSRIQFNPIVSTWELVPYSFVVDWFYSVGQALNALSFLALNNRYTASYGVVITGQRNVNYQIIDKLPKFVVSHTWHEQSLIENWEIKLRRPVYVPSLPQLRLNLNSFKVVDLIALIGQALINLSRR